MKIIKKLSLIILIVLITITVISSVVSARSLSNHFCLYEIDQYEIFLEEMTIPSKFVTYESIKMFGEFYAFDIYDWVYPNFIDEESVYQYRLMREKKEYSNQPGELTLEIDPNCEEVDLTGRERVEINGDDLFSFPVTEANDGGFYAEVEGAVYLYTKDGIFYCLVWENCGNMFRLYNSMTENVFFPESTVSKLLDKNTAPEVIETLKTYEFYDDDPPETPETPKLPETLDTPETPDTPDTPDVPDTPETPKPPETADMTAIFPIMSVICAGGFTLFAVRRKREN